MQPESRIEVLIRKDTGRFRITWDRDSDNHQLEQEDDGSWIPAEGDIPSRFPARLFSQKEIFSLASDPQALMRIIDDADAISKAEWKSTWDEHERKFRRLRSEQRELTTKLAARERLRGELEDILKRIELFETGDNRETLQQYQRGQRQSKALDVRYRDLSSLATTLKSSANDLQKSNADPSDFDPAIEHEQSALDLIASAETKRNEVITNLNRLADDMNAFVAEWDVSRQNSQWKAFFDQATTSYDSLVHQLQAAGVADPSSYSKLIARRQELEQKLSALAATESRFHELETQIQTARSSLFDHRLELTRRRSEFVTQVLSGNQHVRVRIQAFGTTESDVDREYRQKLGCDDQRFRRDIYSEDGNSGLIAGLFRSLPDAPKERQTELGNRISQLKQDTLQMGSTGTASEKCTVPFAKYLNRLDAHILDVIETWWPEDSLVVDYQRSGGGRWLPIEQGSPGQQTAAMLAFVLSYGNQPIILDQPEDDLDNHLIYDLIVQQIRDTKRTRQIIIATHNPNIVVNGDAEKVLAMDVINSQCVVLPNCSGCLQETHVRDEICRVMEGGRLAFQQRYRRIISEDT